MNKILWLLVLLAFPAFADIDQEAGQTAKTAQPNAVKYPPDKVLGASIAIGLNALPKQVAQTTSMQNTAIGSGALGNITSGGQNTAIGYNACGTGTTAVGNVCIGPFSGKNLTTGFNNLFIGSNAGAGMTTLAYNIILDSSTSAAAACTTCQTSVQIGSGTGAINVTGSTIVGYNAGIADTHGGSNNTVIGGQVGSTTFGSVGTPSNVFLLGASSSLDTATGSTVTALGVGSGHPGSFDTSVGWGALATNVQDSAFQTAFGYNSLTLSNVANAQNTAFGYASCGAVTSGKNNVCLGYNAGATNLKTGSSNILIGSGADTAAATTPSSASNMINIGGVVYYNNNSTAAPAVGACGTGSPTITSDSNNRSGTVTSGTVAASCVITFAGTGYSKWNHCRVTNQATPITYAYTLTTLTVTGTLAGSKWDYDCDGY